MTVRDRLKYVRPYVGVRSWSTHSQVLLVAGLAHIAMGGVIQTFEVGGPRWDAMVIARAWMPLEYWAKLWMIVGVLTIVSSRWPPTQDKWGYACLTGMSAGWGAFYLTGVIFRDTPMANLSGCLVFWLLAYLWRSISSLVNPDMVVVKEVPRGP